MKLVTVTIERKSNELWLNSPYRPDLPPRLKALGGKWDAAERKWHFPLHRHTALKALCKEFWGVEVTGDGLPVEVTHSQGTEAVTLATRLAALMTGMDEKEKELIFSILFEGGEG